MDIKKIADLIKTKRKEKSLTQEELAKKLNVTEKAVSRWETGRGTPDISLLLPLANVLGITVSEILSGHEDKKSDENLKEIIEYIDVSKNKKNAKFLISLLCIYMVVFFFYFGYLKLLYAPMFSFSYIEEVLFHAFFVLLVFTANQRIANRYLDKVGDKMRMKKITYVVLLILYIILIRL